MKFFAYWPSGIAIIWATFAGIAVVRYPTAPAVAWLVTTGAVLLVAIAGANARWVALEQRRDRAADRIVRQLRPVRPAPLPYIPGQTISNGDSSGRHRRSA